MSLKRFPLFWKIVLLVSILVVSLSSVGHSLPVSKVVNPRTNWGWVTDQADVLDWETEVKLNRRITAFEAKTTGEMVVVTIPQVDSGTNVRQFAIALFNFWGIGKAEKDNGVLLLLSMKDRRVELVTGSGIEHILTNAIAKKIVQEKIIPPLRAEDPGRAVLAGTDAILTVLYKTEINLMFPTIPVLISTVLFGILGFHWLKIKRIESIEPVVFSHYKLLLAEANLYDLERGNVAEFRREHYSIEHLFNDFHRLRGRSFFWGMFALTNLFLATVGYYFPVGLAIAFSLCFPLTFALKNLPQLRSSSNRREHILAAVFMQFLVTFMFMGVFGTLFLLEYVVRLKSITHIHWLVTLILAATVSLFNSINWHKYLIIQRGGGGASTSSNYGEDSFGGSTGGGSSGDSGGSFGGGSTDGGGAGGDW